MEWPTHLPLVGGEIKHTDGFKLNGVGSASDEGV